MTMGIVRGGRLGRRGGRGPDRDERVHPELHQLARQGGEPVSLPVRVSWLDDKALALDVA
jgi:hypothetical protein